MTGMTSMTGTPLPSFIVIGAAKAATTWIGHQLRQDPAIFMPTTEPHYFSTEQDRGPGWYSRLFAEASPTQIVGEKSADYLAHPQAPMRIAAMLPKVRLVAQLRDPVERAYSDYCMLLRRGTVGDDPVRYLDRQKASLPRFLEDGLYHRHLSRFFDHFAREQVEVILYEDIKAGPENVIARVGRHIGTEPQVVAEEVGARLNASEAPLLPLSLRRLLRPIKSAAQPLRGRPWFEAARTTLARPMRYPELTDDLRRRLRDYYADDVARLATLIDRDLTEWLTRETVVQ